MKAFTYLLPWALLIVCEIRHGQPLFPFHGVWQVVFAVIPLVILVGFWAYMYFTFRRITGEKQR